MTKRLSFIPAGAALVLLLGGAAGGGCTLFQSGSQADLTFQLSEAEACGVVGLGLSGVAPFRKSGKLAPEDAAVMTSGLAVTDPICNSATPPSATAAAGTALATFGTKITALAAKYLGAPK